MISGWRFYARTASLCVDTSGPDGVGSLSPEATPSDEDARVIELLRTPGLSIKNLDEETKERVRGFIRRNHIEKGMSLGDLAKLIGNKTSGYTSWLTRQLGIQPRAFEEARLKGIKEKRRKYERRPFDGTHSDMAYLIGFRHGDLSVSNPWTTTVRVASSTTHPDFAELFKLLFERHGHVYLHPRYKRDTGTYEWNLSALLDRSFDFLMDAPEVSFEKILNDNSDGTILGYLAGFLDSDGNIGISRDKLNTFLAVSFYNTSLSLLNFVAALCRSLGYTPLGPYLDKKKGTITAKYGIERKQDYYKVVIARFEEAQSLLSRLPLRHPEKIAKRDLALSLSYREPWASVSERVGILAAAWRFARDAFVEEARVRYLESHPAPGMDEPGGA